MFGTFFIPNVIQNLGILQETSCVTNASSILGIILTDFQFPFAGVVYVSFIQPPQRELKIGSKEPQNRQKIGYAGGLEAATNFFLERATIVRAQGASEGRNLSGKPTQQKTKF